MRVRKLTEDGDYSFGNQQKDFWIDQPEGVAQLVTTRLRLWVGEFFLDTSEGTAYQLSVLGHNKKKTAENELRQVILDTENVDSIESFELVENPTTRKTTVNAKINTTFGTTDKVEVT